MLRSASLFLFLLLVFLLPAGASDKPENWLEVSSPHFTVLSNASEKQVRHVADQFERMRSVFHTAFPDMQIDPASPIVVLAIKDEKGFRALEPETYLGKGKLDLAGLFLRAPDKNYVLLRLDAGGDHPYAVVYHEYTHLISSKAEAWLPLWLSEGFAEFYENTDIRDKDVLLGQPSAVNLALLRQNRLLPLATLFAVDHASPYYQEENKGSIFYAESWALTHYFMIKDQKENTHHLLDYLDLVSRKVDAVSAATRAFGDLKVLQSSLQDYVEHGVFLYFRMPVSKPVDESGFKVQTVRPASADAVRADLLAYNQRTADARALLDQVLREDPSNVLAHETMGYMEFRQGHTETARQWYEQAVKLDSQSYLAHYYFAAMSLNGAPLDASGESRVESSLQAAIKLNPSFAPPYDLLAAFYGRRRQNLDKAHMLALNAVQLDPGNVNYRMNTARILLALERDQDAIAVMRTALRLAKSPEQIALVQDQLDEAQRYHASREAMEEENQQDNQAQSAVSGGQSSTGSRGSDAQSSTAPGPAPEVPRGLRRTVKGTIKDVRCTVPAILEVKVKDGSQTFVLRSDNYFKIQFTALNYTPKGNLRPCADLEDMQAQIEFIASPGKSN